MHLNGHIEFHDVNFSYPARPHVQVRIHNVLLCTQSKVTRYGVLT